MVTLGSTQKNFIDIIKELVELNYDAIKAYEAAIERLETSEYRKKLMQFKIDHEHHITELSRFLNEFGETPPTGGSAKQILTQGKVIIANLMGDKAILKAMKDNEDDVNIAYERAIAHEKNFDKANKILVRELGYERKHRAWLEETLAAI